MIRIALVGLAGAVLGALLMFFGAPYVVDAVEAAQAWGRR